MGEVCFRNISRKGEVFRYQMAGGLMVVFFAATFFALREASYVWRFLAMGPFIAATIYFFQARAHTCVLLAATGEVEIGGQLLPQEDPAEEMGAIKSAQEVWAKIFLSNALVGSALLGLPMP